MAVLTPPPSAAPCALDFSLSFWPALEARNLCGLTLEAAWVWAL